MWSEARVCLKAERIDLLWLWPIRAKRMVSEVKT